jgi:hypothetical protein
MELTPKEQDMIRDLLAQQGITSYEILLDAPEGSLPEGPFPKEVRAWSGYIVTSSNIYSFWLGWYDGHYTLGQERGLWEEEELSELSPRERTMALEFQRELKQ